jgi:hypothetical protein
MPDTVGIAAAATTASATEAAVVIVGHAAEDECEYIGSFDPGLAALYRRSAAPDALAELARV